MTGKSTAGRRRSDGTGCLQRTETRSPKQCVLAGTSRLLASFAVLSLKLQPAGAFTPVRPVLTWYRGWYAEPRNWERTADVPLELSNIYDDATMRRPISQVRAVGVPGFTCTCCYHCEQLFDITAAMIIAG
ncbi:hypothetical protein NET03_03340 [Thermomicrobium sp. CFH 73360]|uniref:hypothetical protein n=1 Tax=Thermomicrobium sp. CFH 73360 TaxID=2951987 RepID=UPI002076AC13|nr:hypothetical protein [Thermomicrobium sp. CFH 73360]MCM8745559.1 hypothetical protein [Thermomicrobium sp. CFH 73360]